MPKLVKPKPIRRARVVIGLGVWRIPEIGPITPRLKPETDARTRAIGFRADISGEKDK